MKVIPDFKGEPEWSKVGLRASEFRPHFDGDLVNLWTTVIPEATRSETESMLVDRARGIAKWIIKHRKRFATGDRFQIIVGWPESVRPHNRQAVKVGGELNAVQGIADGSIPIAPQPGWDYALFEKEDTEQNGTDLSTI